MDLAGATMLTLLLHEPRWRRNRVVPAARYCSRVDAPDPNTSGRPQIGMPDVVGDVLELGAARAPAAI